MSVTALLFTTSLGLSSVAFPLIALATGRTASEIGLLVAMSAVVQILARSRLGHLMRRVPDRVVFAGGPVGLALAFTVLLVSSTLAALVLAWAVLALGRACFWTAGQTHSVRGTGSSVRRLAALNVFGSSGALVGPVLAGLLVELDTRAALATGAGLAVAALLPVAGLDRFPPFSRKREQPREPAMWRRPGVSAGCWAGATAGAWRGLMDSFVPVALERARHSSATIGMLVSAANAAAVASAALLGGTPSGRTRQVYVGSMLSAALGMAAFGYASGNVAAAAVALAVAGLGAGVLQTLGPALAASAVSPDEKGDAMAAYGTLRTSAMFVAPLATSAAILVMPIAPALLLTGLLLAVPTIAVRTVASLRDTPAPSSRA